MLCHGMFVLSACTMMLSESFPGVAAAMVMNALAYNFASGSREALAYDSLKEVGQEEKYASFSSWELMIYRIGNAAATLLIALPWLLDGREPMAWMWEWLRSAFFSPGAFGSLSAPGEKIRHHAEMKNVCQTELFSASEKALLLS